MAYEFTKLSDVEVVAEPSESANVLIEENGVIKKAPKTAMGGSADSEWDLEIYIEYDSSTSSYISQLISGDYETLKNIIDRQGMPKIHVFFKDGGLWESTMPSNIQWVGLESLFVFKTLNKRVMFTSDHRIIVD